MKTSDVSYFETHLVKILQKNQLSEMLLYENQKEIRKRYIFMHRHIYM
jgi:hypothetical protein